MSGLGQDGPNETVVLTDKVTEDLTLKNGLVEVDYGIEGVLGVTATLPVEPGTVIQMDQHACIGVYDNGAFQAKGTSAAPILITGSTHNKGWWRGIHIESQPEDNVLEYLRIEDAGSNYVYCCNEKGGLVVKNGSMDITKSNISDNDGCGIYKYSAAILTESNNSYSNNTNGDICE